MHGAGNDFVVIDARERALELTAAQARHLADRHRGVGCDQILMLIPSADADFGYRIFNAEGGEVEQCGNGARALALFARPDAPQNVALRMASPAGIVRARFTDDAQVSVDMGPANFEPSSLPFAMATRRDHYEIEIDGQTVRFGAVSMGNPHAVIEVDDINGAPVQTLGPKIQQHDAFPQSVNVGFMQVHSPQRIDLRVYERGVGETLACGTGACAAAAVGAAWGKLASHVDIALPGGQLMVNCEHLERSIWLTGPAHSAFEGHIEL
ncbi:MAG: diaminopimelate epimerase [Gammaproteobacteria bacterium]